MSIGFFLFQFLELMIRRPAAPINARVRAGKNFNHTGKCNTLHSVCEIPFQQRSTTAHSCVQGGKDFLPTFCFATANRRKAFARRTNAPTPSLGTGGSYAWLFASSSNGSSSSSSECECICSRVIERCNKTLNFTFITFYRICLQKSDAM